MLDTAQVSDETAGEHYFCYVLRCHPSVRARRGSTSRRGSDRRRGAADAKSGVAEPPADDGVGGGAEIPWVISRRFEDFQQLRAALTLRGRALNNGTEGGAAGGTGLRGAGTAAPRGEVGASDAKWLAVTEATEVAFPADASTWRDRLERSLSTEAQLIAVRREAMEMWLSNLLTLCADDPLLTRQAPLYGPWPAVLLTYICTGAEFTACPIAASCATTAAAPTWLLGRRSGGRRHTLRWRRVSTPGG